MSPSPNWYSVPDENGQPEYHWTDGGEDGIAWQEDGNWKLQASYDLWQRHEVGHAHSVQHALDKADEVLDEFMLDRQIKDVGPAETRTVGESDLRNVVNLASEIEDRSPEEQASLDRLTRQLERPAFDRAEGNGYEL